MDHLGGGDPARSSYRIKRPDDGFALQGIDQIGGDGGAVVVEDVTCAEILHVREVLGRGGGEDFVAGGDGELDGAAADAGGTAPDQEVFPIWFLRRHGRWP